MKNNLTIQGFTLLEIMISLFILTIIGVLIASGLHAAVTMQASMVTKNKFLANIQLANMIFERDIQQIVSRPIYDESNQLRPWLIITDSKIEFTSGGYINPYALYQRSTLQRVAYELKDNNLLRETWDSLDRTPDTKMSVEILLFDVQSIHFQLLPTVTKPSDVKRAIQIEVNFSDSNYYKRIIPLEINVFDEKNKK